MLKFIDPFIQLTNTEKWANRGVCIEQIFGAFGVIGNTPCGEFSIYGSPSFSENSRTDEEVEGTGVYSRSTSEILLRIVRARMIHTTLYYSRDAYDVVVAILIAPKELKLVLENLTFLERVSLEFDRQRTDVRIRDLEELIQPKYPQIVVNLQAHLFNALTEKMCSEDFQRILNLDEESPN